MTRPVLDWLVIAAYVVVLLWALLEVVSSDRAAIYKLAWVAVMLVATPAPGLAATPETPATVATACLAHPVLA